MAEDEQVERCAQVCDSMAAELEGLRPTAQRAKYDRQSRRQIDYAIRAVKRVAERIRALKGVDAAPALPSDPDKLQRAIDICKELRPVIAGAKRSIWRQEMLARLDSIINP